VSRSVLSIFGLLNELLGLLENGAICHEIL
jgi:hypothetical protein